jgi:hypothetical protein
MLREPTARFDVEPDASMEGGPLIDPPSLLKEFGCLLKDSPPDVANGTRRPRPVKFAGRVQDADMRIPLLAN